MAPGNPRPNYYTGPELTATVKNGAYGIYHTGNVSPDVKYLHKIAMQSGTAGAGLAVYILCDYLLFYPLIDMDSTDEQIFINYADDPVHADALPRYTDGVGVRAFLVATNPYIGGQLFSINYTNSDGTSGRISPQHLSNSSTYISTLVNSGTTTAGVYPGAFISLVHGDKGIRSVESITFQGPNGGLATLVLVKPLATLMTREITAWSEWDFIKDKPSMPRIYDGAYLNLLCMCSATVAANAIIGEATFIWGG
jgi:hypothetical protein